MRRGGTAAAAAIVAAAVAFAPAARSVHDNTPPETRITRGPGAKTSDRTPTFSFSANEAKPRFLCKLDGGRFEPCSSPKTYGRLPRGRHGFYVKAIDPFSNVDPTAAAYTFKVVRG